MYRAFLVSFLAAMIAIIGCQGNPTIPSTEDTGQAPSIQTSDSGNHRCLGWWTVIVDAQTMDLTLLPTRAAGLHLNLTSVLNSTMGVKAAGVPSESDPAHGLFVFDITLKHPFGTKPELAGFDVKGILMTPGTLMVGSLAFADVDETRLENADGYTRWWNAAEFTQPGMFGYTQGKLAGSPAASLTAKVNPYKYFADALTATDSMEPVHLAPLDGDDGRAVFKAGTSNTRRYRIRFPMNPGPQVVYGYAVDASWAAPTPNPPMHIPDDFPIQANQPEPYDLVLTSSINTLFYDADTGMKGGVLRLSADVYDWQGQAAADISGQVDMVRVYAPGLLANPVDASFIDETATNAQYSADLTGQAKPTQPGDFLVAVRAESSDGGNYAQGLGYPAPSSGAISSWQTLPVEVVDPECVADNDNTMFEAVKIDLGQQITDTMCDAVNSEDWYYFQLDPGLKPEGEIRWYEDAEKAKLELYDSQAQLLAKSGVTGGVVAKIELDPLDLNPGTYYIHLMVDQFTTAGPGTLLYLLEPDIDLVDITPDNPVDITPPYLDCDVTWIDSYGDYAFAAGPAGYWVYDISDHTKSVFVSRIYDTCGVKPAFFYPYLYSWEDPAANPAGIDLIDFSDPANPVLHEDALVINHEITAITMNSQYLYVAWVDGITPKVSIYEYSADPMSPTWLNDFDISDLPIELGLVNPEGAHPALIVMEEHRTQAFHVEDPLNVYATGAINNQNNITSKHIAVSGLYILHTWQDNNLAYGVSVLHCSPITGLSNDSSVHYPGDGSEVTADGTTAYVAAGTEGIQVIDFTNPQAATVAGKVEAMGPSVYVHSDGDILLCATVIGLCVYDTSISLNPILVTMPAGLNAPTQAAFIDDLAVFLQDLAPYSAFTIVNNADPFHPRVTFSLPTPETLDLISLLGSVLIFGSSTEGSLAFLDSDTFPSFSSGTNKDFAACIASVALTELRCYVSLDNGLIYIFDISAFPTIVDIMPAMFPVPLSRMMVKGPYLYGADGQNLRVLSLANIDFPIQVNNIPIGHDIKELKVRNNYLYALTTDTLEVLDLSTPDAPSIVGTVTLPHAPGMQFMDLDNQYAYVADADHPVVAVNLWPPDGPQVYGDVTKPQPGFPTKGLLINNGFLYEMHDTIGLKIYDLY